MSIAEVKRIAREVKAATVPRSNSAFKIGGLFESIIDIIENIRIESPLLFKGTVETTSTLPERAENGDTYYVTGESAFYTYTGESFLKTIDIDSVIDSINSRFEEGEAERDALVEEKVASITALQSSLSSEVSRAQAKEAELQGAIADQNDEIADFKGTITDQVNNYQPIQITGDVTNAADEEDLTSENNLLKLKNRSALNGMGYTILRRGSSFASQVTLPNTIYEIRYDFDLGGGDAVVPENVILLFIGGSLKNGTLVGNNTCISSSLCKIFGNNLELSGTFKGSSYPEWYGSFPDETASICVALSINKLFNGFNVVELQYGTYYASSGTTINAKNIIGKSGNSTISFSNLYDGFIGIIFGIDGSSSSTRSWRGRLSNLRIMINSEGKLRTECLRIGATTKAYISNIFCENLNVRSSEYTDSELESPHTYSNFGMVFNGSSELLTISHYSIKADIPIYMKTSTDFTSFISGYCQVSEFGFASVYGNSIGTNSRIVDTDFARGLYGVYTKTEQSTRDWSRYENVRIEQLRTIDKDGEKIGCNFYFCTNKRLPNIIINDCILGIKSNGFYLEGGVGVSAYNIYTPNDKDKSTYCVKIVGNEANFTSFNASGKINSPIIIPEGYQVRNYNSPRLNGVSNNENIELANLEIYYENTLRFDTTHFYHGISKFCTKRDISLPLPQTASSSVLFSLVNVGSTFKEKIRFIKVTAEVFAKNIYSKMAFLIFFERDENGVITQMSELKEIYRQGDDIFNITGSVNLKINLYLSSPTAFNIHNRYGDVNITLSTEIFTDNVLMLS